MADEETTTDEPRTGSDENQNEKENKRPDDTLAKEKKCPECDEPVDDVRATCINCGYEYKDEDHEDDDAGSEFVSGSQIDDDGNELPDEAPSESSNADDDSSGGERDDEEK